MAILKHISSKNANYDDVLVYYTYQHEEDLGTGHYEPILDEYGQLQERENYAITYVTAQGNEAPPERWAADCNRVNLIHGKNENYGEVKNHTYIISHPAEDRQRMTMEDLLAEGKAFAQTNLKGYGVLIAVHRDTDNDHIHITINSVRELAREEQPWMQKNEDGRVKHCEIAAGGKHQDNGEFLRFAKDWLLEYTRQQGLALEDNNDKADRNKAARRSNQIHVNGKPLTKHQRELRAALLKTIPLCCSFQELQTCLKEEYGITLKRTTTGKTISLIHPENEKAVRLQTLGLDLEIFNSFADLQQDSTAPAEEQHSPASDGSAAAAEAPPKEEAHTKKGPYAKASGGPSTSANQYYEDKPYVFWLENRRQKNTEKTERIIDQAEKFAGARTSTNDGHPVKEKYTVQGLEQTIQRTVYAEQDLQTEVDKLDIFLGRWQQYLDPKLPQAERDRHGRYLRWCGCDPDSLSEFEKWSKARQDIDAQKKRLADLRCKLRQKKFSIPNEARKEEKNYHQWLRDCRLKNAEKAEDTIARAEALVAERLRARGEFYSRDDFRELNYLLRKTTYVERDLQTEADKLDKILSRWQQYWDPELSQPERDKHGSYLRWCGCDPDSPQELAYLKAQGETLAAQLAHIKAVRETLVETAERWRGWNDEPVNKLNWTIDRERELKEQLKTIRANRITLGEIANNCSSSVSRRIYKDEQLDKAEYFRKKWMDTLQKEKQLQHELRELKRQKWTIRSRSHDGHECDFGS